MMHKEDTMTHKKDDLDPDPLLWNAKMLVGAARMNAVTAYATWTERFPHVENFDPTRWEMVMGTASVFVALQRLPDFGMEKDRGSTLTRTTIYDLKNWAPGMIARFRDCRSFYFRTFGRIKSQPEYVGEPQLAAADALGSWILRNLCERAPESKEEIELERGLGVFVIQLFHTWWDEPFEVDC